jgi:hypothetical protein
MMPFRIFKHWDAIDQQRQGVLVMVDIGEHDEDAPLEVHFLQGFINDEKHIKTVDDFDKAVMVTGARQLVLSVYDLPKLCAEVLAAAHEVTKEWEKQLHDKATYEAIKSWEKQVHVKKARTERQALTDQR